MKIVFLFLFLNGGAALVAANYSSLFWVNKYKATFILLNLLSAQLQPKQDRWSATIRVGQIIVGQIRVANSAGDNSEAEFFPKILNFNIAFYKLKIKLLRWKTGVLNESRPGIFQAITLPLLRTFKVRLVLFKSKN